MDLARISRMCVLLLAAVGGCAAEESPVPAGAPQVRASVPPDAAPVIAAIGNESTGIAACDAYLARIDTCSRQIFARLPGDTSAALSRIETSLDMMRRSWRNAELTPKGRANLAETCADSLKMYDSSVAGQCPD